MTWIIGTAIVNLGIGYWAGQWHQSLLSRQQTGSSSGSGNGEELSLDQVDAEALRGFETH